MVDRPTKVIAATTAVLAGLALLVALVVPLREERHVNANERVAAEFPAYPDAVESSREHHEKHQNEAFLTTDWTTSITYRVPPSTTAEDVIPDTPSEINADIDNAVAKMFLDFPPGPR